MSASIDFRRPIGQSDSIELLAELIAFDSVSSNSNEAISQRVAEYLGRLGFEVQHSRYLDHSGVTKCNLVARRDPTDDSIVNHSGPSGLAYFCHTDVVPAIDWTGPGDDPFSAVVRDKRVYGRGACDMKGSLVCMMAAASKVSAAEQTAPLWIVCTADEEVGFVGARRLVADSHEYRKLVEFQPVSIIGEPTRLAVVHAHKGITGFRIAHHGRAAHSSTDTGVNANDAMIPLLQSILDCKHQTLSDADLHDARFDPPHLSWNYGHSDHCTAINITPGRSDAWVSLRTMPQIDGGELIQRIRHQAESNGLTFKPLQGGSPVWIEPDAPWIRALCQLLNTEPITVCYATDGGELGQLDRRVVIGPGDIAQAHTSDEWISIDQIDAGTDLYTRCIRKWC